MRAGRLDRKITIQRFVSGQDPRSGQPTIVWTALAHRRWAVYRPVSGDEKTVAHRTVAGQIVEFTIHYSASLDLTAVDRILYPAPDSGAVQAPPASTIYEITEVAEIGRRVGLKIMAVRRAEPTQ